LNQKAIQAPSATTRFLPQPRLAWRRAVEKMENKERFPLSHGTATAIFMNPFTKFVALGF
jgi:hypothetical protein